MSNTSIHDETPVKGAPAVLRDANELSPEDRVIKAGMLLIKHNRRFPTQDEVVGALTIPGQKGTAKATVNKYWRSFQNTLARELQLAEWLPNEIPGFVAEHLKALVDWARADADRQLKDKQRALDAQAQKLATERQQFVHAEDALRSRCDHLEKLLDERETEVRALKPKVEALALELSDARQQTAVQQEQLHNAAQRLVEQGRLWEESKRMVSDQNTVIANLRSTEASVREDKQLLEQRVQRLEGELADAETRVNDYMGQLTLLDQRLLTSETQRVTADERYASALQQLREHETRIANLSGLQSVIDALQGSVDTLTHALQNEQTRNDTLTQELLKLKSQRPPARSKK